MATCGRIGANDRSRMAEPGGAIDQQSPDPMRADVTERDGRPLIGLASSDRRIVVGITVAHRHNSEIILPLVNGPKNLA